ncbi:tetratricopeptide repeat protein [Poseidonibacter lekithochrous]|uniref:tetratricopeptide repeat protein n=1 Tax=Poseidonibacter lekithochrous TaxID=1904463 RepID=UPI000D3889FE|nr:tetratricopeptide repeat protein [Poseidonibacter lekithochrous]
MEDRLRELIRENKVIPFVGAGVSLAVKDKYKVQENEEDDKLFVSWKKLLDKLADGLLEHGKKDESDIVKLSLKIGENYLEIADKIKKYYPLEHLFFDKLEEVFDKKREDVYDESLTLPKSIWNLGQKFIITTNYDNVLDWSSPERVKHLDIQSDYELASSVREEINEETILYLHGHIDKKSNIVLTTDTYNRLYNDSEDAEFKIALETLKVKLATKSFLFFGYSLDDEFFIDELEKVCNNFGNNSSEHYILLEKGKTLPSRFEKKIIPIYFESKGQKLIDKINSLKPLEKNTKSIIEEVYSQSQPASNTFHSLTSLPAENKEYFIGREKELEEIEKKLNSNSLIYIVNGIGGVGKSEISSRYFHQNKNKYKNVAFIEMTEESPSLEEVFKTKFKKSLSLEDDDTFDTVIQRLQNLPQRNLLFLDNIEKKEDFEKVKALNVSFDLLITTRITNLSVKNQLNLDTLNPKDAKDLFLSIYDEDENIEDILKYLDNHPLFITLTASSLSEEYISLEELRGNIKNKTISKIDSKEDKTFEEHLQSTFDKQFLSVEKDELKNLLQILAFFPSIEIDYEILEKSIAIDNLKSKLQKLVKQGWLNKKDNTYKLHQIIKTFIYDKYPLEYEEVSFVLKNIGNYVNPDDSILIANKLDGYIPIIESLLSIYKNKEDENICAVLDSLTYILYSQGLYQESLDTQNKAFSIRQKIFDTKSEFIAKSQYLLSIIYQSMGEYKKALGYSEKALKLRGEILGDKHPDLATSYNNIASIYKLMGEYKKALEYSEKALKLSEEVLGDKHPDLATSYNNIALIYQDRGEYKKALGYSEKTLKLNEEVLGNKHPDLATSYNNIALIYQAMGEYKKALGCSEKALKLREEILGNKHPALATSYNNIASIYQYMGEYKKALEYSEKDLKLNEEVLGDKHPVLATSYNNSALIYKDMGEYKKALEYSEKALKLREEILGDKHPDLASSYNNVASIYQDMGEYKKALECSEKDLKLSEEVLGDKHPDLATSYNNIAGIYKDLKLCNKVKENIEKAINIWKESEYHKKQLFSANQLLKEVNYHLKKENKLNANKRGKFCKDV